MFLSVYTSDKNIDNIVRHNGKTAIRRAYYMNPFKEKSKKPEDYLDSIDNLFPKPYDKNSTSPYTKTRIILACGAEYEANWHSHQMLRNIADLDVRRNISLVRFLEKQQQQYLAQLKPADESILETTIAYEQLAVDLTAEMARKEKNFNVKKALDFALLEDFDHLYRYADLLDNDYGIHAERLVGKYTELTPGRPTVAHHRHPIDNVKGSINAKNNDIRTVLNTMIITAAEQQTMNFYMNVGSHYINEAGKRLYEEICLVEEEHVTQYGSLIDTSSDWFECLVLHEYAECFVYWSNYMTETDERFKKIWEYNFESELSHLHAAVKMLEKYDKKSFEDVIPHSDFPEPLELKEHIDYVREILASTVQYTGKLADYRPIGELSEDDRYFLYNARFNSPVKETPSHKVISDYIKKHGKDYRFEVKENPVPALRKRDSDNIEVGITPSAAKCGEFKKA